MIEFMAKKYRYVYLLWLDSSRRNQDTFQITRIFQTQDLETAT